MNQNIIKSLLLWFFHSDLVFKKSSGLLLGIVLGYSYYPGLAQAESKITVNQNNLTQPLFFEGISGGAIIVKDIAQTEKTATGYCDGYVNSQPNHLLKLESFWQSLRLEINSQADTTILVKGPGGIWCNDDSGTVNPIIEGQWQPGLYQIWVGSYQANVKNNYQIKITGN